MNENQRYINWQLFKWIGWIAFFGLFFFMRMCQGDTTVKKNTIPEIKGKFETNKVDHEPIIISNKETKFVYLKQDASLKKTIDSLLDQTEKMKKDFAKMPDTVKIIEYEKAIQLNEFSKKVEDDTIIIDIHGASRGTIENLFVDYTVKKREIDIPVKKKIGVYFGSEIGTNTNLNQFTYKLNLGVQNKKGTIYTTSYQKTSSNNYILIGMNFKLL
jgi:hypothetical protein